MTDPSSRSAVPPPTSGRDWTPLLGLVLLLLAGGLAVAKAWGQGPANLQTGSSVSTFYPAVLAYEYAAFPITGALLLAWVVLVALWLKHLRQPLRRRTASVAVAMTTVALLWSGLSTLQQLLIGYTHVETLTTGARDYHLGIRTALDGDYFFIVSQCPHEQRRCTAYGVAPVAPDERADFSRFTLTIGSAPDALVIQTPSRTIPFRVPTP